jgi:hypothetical protein
LYNAIKTVARKHTCGATLEIWRLVSGKKRIFAKILIQYRLLVFFAKNNKTAGTEFLYFVLQNRSRTPTFRLLMLEGIAGEQEIVSGSTQLIK